jgi:hypothetical protein
MASHGCAREFAFAIAAALVGLLLSARALAVEVAYDMDTPSSAFAGSLSVTAAIETYGDSNSTGGGSGTVAFDSIADECIDYETSGGGQTWFCVDRGAALDWGSPAWSSLDVTLGALDGFLEVQEAPGTFPVSVSVPTGIPLVPPIVISGTADPEINAIRVVSVDVPASVFDLSAQGPPDPGPTDPGPGPWSVLAPTEVTFRIDWCATFTGAIPIGAICTVTDVVANVPVRYVLERGARPGQMSILNADFGPITLTTGASPRYNRLLPGCEVGGPFGICLFDLTSIDLWLSSMSVNNLLGHFVFDTTGAPIPNQPECNDVTDDDGDSAARYPFDTSCARFDTSSEISQCSDGLDNDLDLATDHPEDASCPLPWLDDEALALQAPLPRELAIRHAGAVHPRAQGWTETVSGACTAGSACRRLPILYESFGREQAWLVEDGSATGLLRYERSVLPAVDARAADHGWTLRARLRIAKPADALDPAINVMYGDGSERFRMDFGSTAAGDPIVRLGGGPVVPALTGLGPGHHTFELIFDPISEAARLLVDGVDQGVSYGGEASTTNGVEFGSASTVDVGAANFALVEWLIHATECGDGEDNDGDGLADLADPACDDAFSLSESPCADGRDNDGDGRLDFPSDPGCASATDDSERDASRACDDGIDNDSDGRSDFPADPGCKRRDDLDEANPTQVVAEHAGAIDPVRNGWTIDAGPGVSGFFSLVAPGADPLHPGWTIEDSIGAGMCDEFSSTPGLPCTTDANCAGRTVQGECEDLGCAYPSADWGDLCLNDFECEDGTYTAFCIPTPSNVSLQRARYVHALAPGEELDAQDRGWIVRAVVDVESPIGSVKTPDGSISVVARSGFGIGRSASGSQIRLLPSGTIATLGGGPGPRLFEMAVDPTLGEARLSIDGTVLLTVPGAYTPPDDIRFGADGTATGRGDYSRVQLVVGQAPSCPGLPTPPPGADSDGDGLADSTEQIFHHSDPCLVDGDGDGLDDPDEIALTNTDPADADTDHDGTPDAAEDADGDGLTHQSEVNQYGTNPLDADSDDDGLGDGFEVGTSTTNPLDADSDDDGLSDGAELNLHETDPLDADSDDDGLGDGDELNLHGTDPNLADTDGDNLSDYAEVVVHGTDPLVPELNTDGDLLPDIVDNCAFTANDQTDSNGDGIGNACTCGDLDADGFGVLAGDLALLRAHFADPVGAPLSPGAAQRCVVSLASSGCNLTQSVVMARAIASLESGAAQVCAPANPAPTSPADVAGLALWLDADDASTLTTDGLGRRIWADKSPNGLDVMAPSAAASPAVGGGVVGGLGALRFDGQDDVMCANGALDLSAGATIFVVARNDVRKNYNGLLSLRAAVAGLPSAGASELELYWQVGNTEAGSGNLIYAANRTASPDYFGRDNLAPGVGGAYLATVEVWSTTTPGRIAIQGASGSNDQIESNSASMLPDAPAQPCVGYGFGISAGAANLLDGTLAELVVFDRLLTDDERSALERTLQAKWSTRFAPAALGSLALWLDADDRSSLSLDPDGSVVAWKDKRPGTELLVASGAGEQPLRQQTGNTPATVVFDGVDDYLCGANPIDLSAAGNPGGATFYFVTRNRVRKSFNGIFSLRTGPAVNAVQEIYWQTGTTDAGSGNLLLLDDRGTGTSASVVFNNAPPPVNALSVFLMQLATPTSVGITRIGGASVAPSSASASNLLPASAAPPCVGYGFGTTPAGNTLDGEIAEILLFDETLGSANAGLVESYLLRKWGVP